MKTLEDLPVVDVNDGVECLVKNDPEFEDVRRIIFAKTKDGRFLGFTNHAIDVFDNPLVYCYKYAEPIQPKILPLSSVNDIPAWCFGRDVFAIGKFGDVKIIGRLAMVGDMAAGQYIVIDITGDFDIHRRCDLEYAMDEKFEIRDRGRIFKFYREIPE